MQRKGQRGFSLVEVIVVIGTIMVVGAVAIPAFQSYTANMNLRNAAREIQGDFFICKERAISENRRYRIRFDVAANEFTLQQCQGPDICLSTCLSPCSYVVIQKKTCSIWKRYTDYKCLFCYRQSHCYISDKRNSHWIWR